MRSKGTFWLVLSMAAALAGGAQPVAQPGPQPGPQAGPQQGVRPDSQQGAQPYEQALPGYHYEFPRDFFNHPAYQTEWCYYTGNVTTADGHRFGFELTFFRQGVSRTADASPWYVHDLYMAHMAISDISGGRFYHAERLNRSGPGIAGVDETSGTIWNGNWQVRIAGAHEQLRGSTENLAIDLKLDAAKPPVVQGQNGVSQKSEGSGHASHYISLTRLGTSGTLRIGGISYAVTGTSWMDHEFFTGGLDAQESGWDWLSLQLADNTEIMLYRLRHKDGSIDPCSSGSYVDAHGAVQFLSLHDFTMTPAGPTWTSAKTHGVYPTAWHVSIPRLGLELDVSTPLAAQELDERIGPSYWEGAIDVSGRRGTAPVRGVGYLEMTGYAGPEPLQPPR